MRPGTCYDCAYRGMSEHRPCRHPEADREDFLDRPVNDHWKLEGERVCGYVSGCWVGPRMGVAG